MHILPGTLIVEEIQGRKGLFCVGTLKTSIGDFKVKDSALDQFAVGAYTGSFTIEKIFTKGVPWRGGFFTEIIAQIARDGFLIDKETDSPESTVPALQAEPDPLDDSKLSALAAAENPGLAFDAAQADSVTSLVGTIKTADTDLQLFGLELQEKLTNGSQEIKLDPTVERQQFRLQRDRLKEMGYRFDFASQQWLSSKLS